MSAVLATLLAVGGCGSSSPPAPTPTPAPSGTAAVPTCSAAHGRLTPSHPAFAMQHRLIQPFSYLNAGGRCYADGFPAVRFYNASRKALNVPQINGHIVLGTDKVTRTLLQSRDDSSGFNVETPQTGSCVTARFVSASFGHGTTPLAAINYRLCGRVYVTTLYR